VPTVGFSIASRTDGAAALYAGGTAWTMTGRESWRGMACCADYSLVRGTPDGVASTGCIQSFLEWTVGRVLRQIEEGVTGEDQSTATLVRKALVLGGLVGSIDVRGLAGN
jgi:hypothetical protein